MNTYSTAEDLLAYIPVTGVDTYGTFHIITGYEGTGGCFWCGKDLEGKRRRYCGNRSGCWTNRTNAFYWTYARSVCLEAYDYRCANCGKSRGELDNEYARPSNRYYSDIIESQMEVHHIIPLEGRMRQSSPFNLAWNLICLCHKCHQDLHLILNAAARPPVLTHFELAKANGQLVLAGLVER